MRRALLTLLALAFAAGAAVAQPAAPQPATKPAAGKPAQPAARDVRPAWGELTVEQQRVLAPLKADWDSLDRERKLKWVGIAKRYPNLSVQEQERIQRRMQTWAKLTPQQRRQARETYKQLAKQPPQKREQLRERWAEYQRERPSPSPYPTGASEQ